MKRWALLLATICALLQLGETAASAAWVIPPRAPVTSQALLDRYLPTARAAWPGSPCEGQERVTLDDDVQIDEFVASRPDLSPHGDDVAGVAFGVGVTDPSSPDYCRIGLRGPWASGAATAFCVALTHELGHLAGRDHNDIPGDVMNPSAPTYAPCMPSRRDQLDALLRIGLPRPNVWTFSCLVVRGGVLSCKASAPFARYDRYLRVSPHELAALDHREPR